MPPETAKKPLRLFLIHAAFGIVLLNVIPTVATTYPILFGRLADSVFTPFAGEHRVEFDWVQPSDREQIRGEVHMSGLMVGRESPIWEVWFSISDRGYRPTATLVALTLATGMTRRRVAIAVLGGIAIYHALLLVQLALVAGGLFSQLRPEVFGEALSDLLPVTRAVFASPVPRYIVVLAIWAALARPEQGVDFSGAIRAAQRLLGSKAAAAAKEQEPKGR